MHGRSSSVAGASIATAVIAGLLATTAPAAAQPIDPSRGVDARVDYASLARFGPWDDRNYQLTAEDLAFLAPNEHELHVAIPAFFRVGMRKAWPSLRREGPVQYPLSAPEIFRQMFGGFLIDGKRFAGVERRGDRFVVLTDARFEVPVQTAEAAEGEVKISSPVGAAESAIAINPVFPDVVIAGVNGSGQDMYYSGDGGETWTKGPDLPLGGTCCDPTIEYSVDGTLAYTSTLGNCGFSGCGIWFYRSGDDGATWTDLQNEPGNDPRRELTNSGSDKQYLHVDRSPTSPYADRIYQTWHDGNVMQLGVSTDFGDSWAITSFSGDPQGIGSDISTDKDGRVYYVYPSFTTNTIRLLRSTDGGASFGASTVIANTQASFNFPLPSMETRAVAVIASTECDLSGGPFANSVYAAWTDNTNPDSNTAANNHGRIQVAYSRDAGTSWTVTTPHPTGDAATVDRYAAWLAVADNGDVHVTFYDTSADGSRQTVDLFRAVSTDGAQTWSVPERLTTVSSPNLPDSFEFGDYNGLSIAGTRAMAIYTDNRNETGGTSASKDVYGIGFATVESIFADGFESGDTGAWSATVP